MNNLNLSNEQLNLLSDESLRALLNILSLNGLALNLEHEERQALRNLERQLQSLLGERRWNN